MRALSILCFVLYAATAQAAVTARLDPAQASLGDTVTLILEATQGDDLGQPDLSSLSGDFRVVGQSSSRNIQIINGHLSSSRQLRIALMPKRTGDLVIPPLKTASGTTAPLTLSVDNNGGGVSSQTQTSQRDIFLDMAVTPTRVWVGQQATVTVRIYYAMNLDSGGLDNLSAPGASVQPLGKPHQYDSQVNGRTYRVYEQQYALFPSDSGKLTIPAANFQGQAIVQNTTNIWGMPMPGFGTPTPVTAASNPVTLTVDPIPADWKGLWLPARKLTLKAEGLPDTDTLTAGTPVNLRLTLTAIGLPATALPDPTLPNLDKAAVYSDKTTSDSGQSGELIRGSKTRSFAILPQQPGTLVIPAIELPWYNTTTGKREVIRLPSRTFTVVAGSSNASTAPPDQTAPAAVTEPAVQTATTATTQGSGTATAKGWRTAFFASLGLWLLTLLYLIWRRKKAPAQPTSPTTTTRGDSGNLQRRLLAGLDKQAPDCLRRLLKWASAERATIITLADLKAALEPSQADVITQLEAWRYGGSDFPALAVSAFKTGLRWRHAAGTVTPPAPLASLYPTDGPSHGNNT